MQPTVLEREPGARRELARRAGDEDLARLGQGQDARQLVDRNAAHVAGHQLDLTGVDRGPRLEVEFAARDSHVGRRQDRTGRAVEGCQEAVTGRGDLVAVVDATAKTWE